MSVTKATPIDPTPDPPTPARTRLDSPGWVLGTSGSFTLDLSWDASTHRWLEVSRDPDFDHGWRLVLWEADDDSEDAAQEGLEFGVQDVTFMLSSIESNPWEFDRTPHHPTSTGETA